eukprot:COSAG05_NODE_7456_length_809_cov_1.142254_1_plen_40_part_10
MCETRAAGRDSFELINTNIDHRRKRLQLPAISWPSESRLT